MKLKQKFSEDDLQRIKVAVKKAEEKISGEIVPVMVERSDIYTIANYRAALACAILVFIFMIVLDRFLITDTSQTLYYDPLFIFIVVIVGGAIGAIVGELSSPVKRFFVAKRFLDEACREAAEMPSWKRKFSIPGIEQVS